MVLLYHQSMTPPPSVEAISAYDAHSGERIDQLNDGLCLHSRFGSLIGASPVEVSVAIVNHYCRLIAVVFGYFLYELDASMNVIENVYIQIVQPSFCDIGKFWERLGADGGADSGTYAVKGATQLCLEN